MSAASNMRRRPPTPAGSLFSSIVRPPFELPTTPRSARNMTDGQPPSPKTSTPIRLGRQQTAD